MWKAIHLLFCIPALGFQLGCGSAGGSTETQAPAPSIISLVAEPTLSSATGTAQIVAVFHNGTGILTPGDLAVTSGAAVEITPAVDTTYTLTVSNPASTAPPALRTVTVSAGPTVYAAGFNSDGTGNGVPGYWKNGTWVGLAPPTGVNGLVIALAVSGSDVYAAGAYQDPTLSLVPGYWKNGTWVGLPTPAGALRARVTSLAVSGGNVYAGGWSSTSRTGLVSLPGYWLNGNWVGLPLPPAAALSGQVNCLTTSGGDVYAGGWGSADPDNRGKVAGYWKNGGWVGLPALDPVSGASVTSLALSSGKVFAGGCNINASGISVPGYWADGTWNGFTAAGSTVSSLAVSGSDVYAAGYLENSSLVPVPGYWKDGSVVNLALPPESGAGNVDVLVSSGSDVYAAGSATSGSGALVPGYWVNATWVALTLPPGASFSGAVTSLLVQ